MLTLVLAGRRNTDIARELFLSLKTIESRTRNIYATLGVTSRVELVTRLGEHDRTAMSRATSITEAPSERYTREVLHPQRALRRRLSGGDRRRSGLPVDHMACRSVRPEE